MKKFIKEKHASLILQLAQKYITDNPDMKNSEIYCAMEKTLETMDMYVAWINNMGFMMYTYSIKHMLEYIASINGKCTEFTSEQLKEVYDYLITL